MALKMSLCIGLHLDSTYVGLSRREADLRQWVLHICVVFERQVAKLILRLVL